MMADVVIGIDPDNKASGVAFLDVATRRLETTTLAFPALLSYLTTERDKALTLSLTLVVVIEGGWLNHGNWHAGYRLGAAKAAAIGRSVGMNHQTGILIQEWCQANGIQCNVVRPLRKCWRGTDGKITAGELRLFTGLQGRTSQDARDAALLAWVWAKLPLRRM